MSKNKGLDKPVQGIVPPIHCAHTELVDIATLVPNPRNPNRHPQEQLELLARIMLGTGVRLPIVVSKRSGFIVKGHGRLEAARINGWTHFPIDRQDYENEAQEWADMIADNKIQELSFHDNDVLKELVMSMPEDFDKAMTGMTGLALDQLLKGWEPDNGKMDAIEPTDEPMPTKLTITVKPMDLDPIRSFIEIQLRDAGYEVKIEG